MRKNPWICLTLVLLMVLAIAGCAQAADSQVTPKASPTVTPAASEAPVKTAEPPKESAAEAKEPAYKDGTYEITTTKDLENYYVKASMVIKDGKITDFHYDIFDSYNKDAIFDENYEQYMTTEYYKQQCRDDLKGMKTYGPKLIETQSVDEVDVVSGATWTWKWFKKVANELLKQAAAK